nr:hypothetical protein [uncultured Roseateles sp.]
MPAAIVERLLTVAGDDVLVGGQALAIWVQRYDVVVPASLAAVSADIDFLTPSPKNRARVEAFASTLGGLTAYPNPHALTALVGQAYRDVSDHEYLNVDVIFSVLGIGADQILHRAVRVDLGHASFLVMHPLHVLRIRLINLYKLEEKQSEKGRMQLAMAIEVARAFLRSAATDSRPEDIAVGRSPLQAFVSEIEKLAVEDAGRKVALRFGLHVADAIDPSLIPAGLFWKKRWPGLKTLMSTSYAQQFKAP